MEYIMMNAEMTEAIFDRIKTQTRRAIKNHIYRIEGNKITFSDVYNMVSKTELISTFIREYSKYQVGDIVWVREPALVVNFTQDGLSFTCEYKADKKQITIDMPDRFLPYPPNNKLPKWIENKKSIPNGCVKEMARIFLKITNVRVERLQDISDEDCIKEGIEVEEESLEWYKDYLKPYDNYDCKKPLESFESLWDKTTPKGYKWEDNPYVFVYEFERVNKEMR